MKPEPILCQRCGKVLDPARIVDLELDQRINAYHDAGVPESTSQGWFPFGAACAERERKAARAALANLPTTTKGKKA